MFSVYLYSSFLITILIVFGFFLRFTYCWSNEATQYFIILIFYRLGSIDVDFNVVSVEQSDLVVSKLARAFWELGKGSNLVLDGQNVIATAGIDWFVLFTWTKLIQAQPGIRIST